jgi:hypothetical protein
MADSITVLPLLDDRTLHTTQLWSKNVGYLSPT